MSRTFASRVSHRRLKWVILVFWLVLAAAAAPLAADLTAQQNNEISSWLPGDAESTLALERQTALGSDPDVIPTVLVYERTEGLTPADLAADRGGRRRPSASSTRSTAPSSARSRPRTGRRPSSWCR